MFVGNLQAIVGLRHVHTPLCVVTVMVFCNCCGEIIYQAASVRKSLGALARFVKCPVKFISALLIIICEVYTQKKGVISSDICGCMGRGHKRVDNKRFRLSPQGGSVENMTDMANNLYWLIGVLSKKAIPAENTSVGMGI